VSYWRDAIKYSICVSVNLKMSEMVFLLTEFCSFTLSGARTNNCSYCSTGFRSSFIFMKSVFKKSSLLYHKETPWKRWMETKAIRSDWTCYMAYNYMYTGNFFEGLQSKLKMKNDSSSMINHGFELPSLAPNRTFSLPHSICVSSVCAVRE